MECGRAWLSANRRECPVPAYDMVSRVTRVGVAWLTVGTYAKVPRANLVTGEGTSAARTSSRGVSRPKDKG